MLSANKKRQDYLNYLLLGLFLLIAYLPLSSLLFALKNDALTDNFPNKYFFSAALHSGHLPLWNPYMNFGLPLYADPGFAFWHPLTWLFGAIGYNIYSLSIEILTYIWLAGIFMFQLGKYFRHPPIVCFCMSAMYMCCGFFIGNLEHINFLTCAAFLPLVTRSFLQLHNGFSFSRLLVCCISLFLLATGGHPAIPFATVYFLAILTGGMFFFRNVDGTKTFPWTRLLKTNLFLLIGFLLIAAPLLYSWLEIFPWFSRSAPVIQGATTDLGFTLPSYVSFLFPFSTIARATFFGNDVLMRNGYFSFIGLALFITALLQKKNNIQRLFLTAGLIMLLLSLGGGVKAALYSHLPLLQYIQTNGEFRVFALFSFIIVASFPFAARLAQADNKPRLFNRILFVFSGICVVVILWAVLNHSALSASPSPTGLMSKIKWVYDHVSWADCLLINAVLLLLCLLTYFLLEKKIPSRILIPGMILADLLLFSWLHLPVTGVQQNSPSEMEHHYFSSVRPGIPIPSLRPIVENRWPGENLRATIGSWSYYSKQPGTPQLDDYPTLFTNTRNYFKSPLPPWINRQAFVFLKPASAQTSALATAQPSSLPPTRPLSIEAFSPEKIIINVAPGNDKDTLVLLQNFYPHWSAGSNGLPLKIDKDYISFMSIPLGKENSRVEFDFCPLNIIWPASIAFLALLTGLLLAIRPPRRVP